MTNPTPTPTPPLPSPQFRLTSFLRSDRVDLVNQTADLTVVSSPDPTAQTETTVAHNPAVAPVSSKLLMLSSLGAWLDLEGAWGPGDISNLAQWKQVTSQGRDHYVRLVHRGYLFPTGHRAVYIEITERRFGADGSGNAIAADLLLHQFVKVLQPEKLYRKPHATPSQPWSGGNFPFVSLRVTAVMTPEIVKGPFGVAPVTQAFWPNVGTAAGAPYAWPIVATDASGHESHFSVPLAFVFGLDKTQAASPFDAGSPGSGGTADLAKSYNALATSRSADLAGAKVTYAPENPAKPGATTHSTVSITLGAATTLDDATQSPAALQGADQPNFYPTIDTAFVRLHAAEQVSRSTSGPIADPAGVAIQYYPPFYKPNAGANPASLYAVLPGSPAVTFPSDAVGAVATPNFKITALSQVVGTYGGPPGGSPGATVKGLPTIADYFAGLTSAQLLGGIPLAGILEDFTDLDQVPSLASTADSTQAVVSYRFSRPLISWPPPPSGSPHPPDPSFAPAAGSTFDLTTTITTDLQTNIATYVVEGKLGPFTVQLLDVFDVISIEVKKFHFTASTGKKPHVDVKLGAVNFIGPLAFVHTLQQFLGSIGGSGFSITSNPTGIKAALTLGLPNIDVGIFSLDNLKLISSINVPFSGKPAMARFSFCTREDPFILSVTLFGGGGFIGLAVGMHGVEMVEASLQFGGNFSIDVGVASGGVTAVAGVYFKYGASSGVEITGFIKLHGEVEILGMISVSLLLDLELQYLSGPKGNRLDGIATMDFEIKILFFSVDVGVTIHKQLAGSDPSFAELLPAPSMWATYCAAFAV